MLISSCCFGLAAWVTTKSFNRTEAVFWRFPLPYCLSVAAGGTTMAAGTKRLLVATGAGVSTREGTGRSFSDRASGAGGLASMASESSEVRVSMAEKTGVVIVWLEDPCSKLTGRVELGLVSPLSSKVKCSEIGAHKFWGCNLMLQVINRSKWELSFRENNISGNKELQFF